MKQLLFCVFGLLLFTSLEHCTVRAPVSGANSFLQDPGANVLTVYLGTYTRQEGHVNGQAKGVYRAKIDLNGGRMTEPGLVAEVTNPSFLKLSNDEKVLIVASELARADEPTGFVHTFRIEGDNLTEVSKLPSNGQAPCHLELDQTGHYAIVSNYVGGTASLYRMADDGKMILRDTFVVPLKDFPGRNSWLHSANIAPDNRLVAIADKGLDRIWFQQLYERGGKFRDYAQAYVELPLGSGPRHTQWSADGNFLYVINELSNTVSVLGKKGDATEFSVLQTLSTLPAGHTGTSYCADLHLHPSGKFLYGSNRGHDSIVIYAINPVTGRLTDLGRVSTRGEFPRNFAVAPDGRHLWVANQNTNNIAAYAINQKTGLPKFLAEYPA
ncbi:MAG: lactonase family protein, partial [Bacteroidota bacterium]